MSSSWTPVCIAILLPLLSVLKSAQGANELCQCSLNRCSCVNQSVPSVESVAEKYCSEQMTELDLSGNHIPVVNVKGGFSAGSCRALTKLSLRSNAIRNLRSKDFMGLDSLQSLDLGDNNFTVYGEFTFSNVSRYLSHLIMDHNPVRVISNKDFSTLYALKLLNLSSNQVGFITENSFRNCCTQLETLVLTENYLTSLDVNMFAGLRQLQRLDLSDNPVKIILNGTFEDLVSLRNLTITYRKSMDLSLTTELQSGVFKPLTSLEVLIVQDLRIASLHAGIFTGLGSHLMHLDFSFNHIVNLSADTFDTFTVLQTLSLRGNRLSCLHNAAFQHLSRLESLDIALNQITYIHNKAFTGLTSLKFLNIHGNPVRNVHSGFPCPMARLESVVIDTRMHQFTFESPTTLQTLFLHNTTIHVVANVTQLSGSKSVILRGQRVSCDVNEETQILAREATAWNISDLETCPFFKNQEPPYEIQGGSRIYLLIIIAICISFLLLAFIVILSYRAWSKRKMLYEEVQTVEMHPQHHSPTTTAAAVKEGSEEITKVMINGTPTKQPSSPVAPSNDVVVRLPSIPNGSKEAEVPRASNGAAATSQLIPARSSTDDDSDTIIALGVV